jgi:hypothetical protein
MLTSKLTPWRIARAIDAAFAPTIAALTFWNAYFTTWSAVYRPERTPR